MLRLKLIHVSKSGPCSLLMVDSTSYVMRAVVFRSHFQAAE